MTNSFLRVSVCALSVVGICTMTPSCTEDIDESDLYTFNGETIEDFLVNNDSAFSSFNYILERCGYDRILSSYGSGGGNYYTCFAPVNDAVAEYIDSLWNDTESKIAHNGMSENSLEGMSDSLCEDIAMFHILGTKCLTTDMSEGDNMRTLLGRLITVSTRLTDGATVLNSSAAITMKDYEVTNGVVHVIDHVIPRSNKTILREMQLDSARFAIFCEALERTDLSTILDKDEEKDLTADAPTPVSDYYIPTECAIGYTLFAETDDVFARYGITSFDELAVACAEWYGAAATSPESKTQGWYDYYRNNNIEISTDTDYTSEHNVVNMFVRYHILPGAVNTTALVLDHSTLTGYGWEGDTYDYWETMLDKTLIKTWLRKNDDIVYINRYVENNTLTDEVEGLGSDAMHEVIYEGCEVYVDSVIAPINGYIYPINDILVYDWQVPNGTLNERMRVDAVTMLPEIWSNEFRGMTESELVVLNGGTDASRIRFPIDYFDNIVVYNGNNTTIDVDVPNNYMNYRGDAFQGMGIFDFAIKLPPVPDGQYEIRINLNCMEHGTMLQYYLGETSDVNDMEAVDVPLDMRITSDFSDEHFIAIGCVDIQDYENNPDDYEDRGLESDRTMRSHGYMRGPLCTCRESDNTQISRFKPYQLRRILDTRKLEQKDYWMRLKTVLDDGNLERKFVIDYVEFCPVNIASNDQYLEDMY